MLPAAISLMPPTARTRPIQALSQIPMGLPPAAQACHAAIREGGSTVHCPPSTRARSALSDATQQLLAYCQANDWAGYDPYDALNSRLLKALPFLDFKLFRLALTQVLKRSPINLRPLLLVPKTQNPKGLALFLMAFLKLSKVGLLPRDELIWQMVDSLVALRSPDTSYWCWGYSFPWQGRGVLTPRGFPSLVCTVFVADALLNNFEATGEPRCLDMASSAARYIFNELFWSSNDAAGFSYPLPGIQAKVHNANFLGAALLCRVSKLTGDRKFLDPALKAARYSLSKQNPDGSWPYGEHPTQKWIDNFHTGYNLCALETIARCAETSEFDASLRRGFEFYRAHFFCEDGAPKYFSDQAYPIDAHSVAQSIITLVQFNNPQNCGLELATQVFQWTMANLWDRRGFFWYQKTPWYTNKIPYMRWSQAWMLLALATLLQATDHR